ncbi:cobalt-precorrin-6A reductase [Methylovirgula sp. 4M-Z18]|uniref:cobalt-precorrin-6A reductase n=1 Tax=Methylovirgula sp. 4M-Z18 TaxID=2293567 RepID=UPI000E2EA9CC|nr:cobalt-precorrin-6A reductase [Methylovirgula sp. 4M-Z18]RFB76294.1 cobalt-precorrin-6A reductase [Methylovirgula sp. 4M-Z18]
MNILILGGTAEAMQLADTVAALPEFHAVFSYAGRTREPVAPAIPYRVGGFGGVEGLRAYVREHQVAAVIDATHPFAAQISANAVQACAAEDVPLCVLSRAPWQATDDDLWISVPDIAASVDALGDAPARVFLTVGRLHICVFARAPRHHYIVRSIEPPDDLSFLPDHKLILARPHFTYESERELMRNERVDILVTKNSGAASTAPKLAAARDLGIRVVMIERPRAADALTFHRPEDVIAWLRAQRDHVSLRP